MTLAVQPISGNSNSLFINTSIARKSPQLEFPSFVVRSQQLLYNNKIRLTLHVSDETKKYFILIKGLIEFSRGENFSFTYDKEAGSLQTDFHIESVALFEDFLEDVQTWLVKEIAFKKALKDVLSFEEAYKKKSALVYSTIF